MLDSPLAVALAAFLIGISKGGLGGAVVGAFIVPLLSQSMTVPQAVGLTLPLLMVGDVFAVRFYWRDWDLRYLKLLLPLAVVGIIMGTFLLANLPNDILKRVLGIFTLIVIGYKLISDSLRSVAYQPRGWHGMLAGWASGFGSALANVGGPPITAYLLLQKLPPTVFVGTFTLFFAIVNWLKVPGFLAENIIEVERLLRIAWALPIIPLGVWIGRRIIGWINPKAFEWLMTGLLLWAGLTMLFS